MKGLALAILLISSGASAQDSTTMTATSDGQCLCSNNGKTWACRQARGNPGNTVYAVNLCHGGGYELVCPADPKAVCGYAMVPAICAEPPLTPVCWAADEPK